VPATFVQRSDGEFYPFALQSVSAGSAIGLANSGGGPAAYIDLSRSWLGEPGPSYGDDELTPRELAELDQVMAEVEAEDAAAAYSALEGFSETFDRNCAAVVTPATTLAITVASGGASFTAGKRLLYDVGPLAEVVTVTTTGTATNIPVAGRFTRTHGVGRRAGPGRRSTPRARA
jgi:hypothetical protein